MSEYVSKKALLESMETKRLECIENDEDYEADILEMWIDEIQSGRFDAPSDDRLRAEVMRAISIWENTCDFADPEDALNKTIALLKQALSATEPTIAERVWECPDCGYDLKPGFRDSLECAKCGYSGNPIKKRSSGINAPEKEDNDA